MLAKWAGGRACVVVALMVIIEGFAIVGDPATAGAAIGTTISIGSASVAETNSGKPRAVVLRVTLSQPAPTKVTVRATVTGGTATAGKQSPADYKPWAKPKVIKFAAGAVARNVPIQILPDTVPEPDETVTIALSDPTGGAVLGVATGTVTIVDDDTSPKSGVRASIGSASIAEGDLGKPRPVVVPVVLSAPATTELSLKVTVTSGSAAGGKKSPADFKMITSPKNLRFPAGKTLVNVSVPVLPDRYAEVDETLTLQLGSPSTGLALGITTGTITILTDDHDDGIPLAGAAEPGATAYAVPSGAIVVSPTGSDSAAGTAAAPVRTLGRAVAIAAAGKTIVLRAGTYNESVVVDKRLTIQAWPNEAVWLDGSIPVTSWTASSGRWSTSWTIEFDSSATYDRGSTDTSWIDPAYPMAAHPEQVWINGVAQRQVGSLSQVNSGAFYHDTAGNKLWLGTDPTGKEVRVSNRSRALMVRAANTVLRGFGVRRYAPSVPDMGSITIEQAGVTVEHLVVTDAATTGLHVGAGRTGNTSNVVIRNVSIARSGMLGFNASYSDKLTLQGVISEGNNTERFRTAPVSGGAKIGRSRTVTVRDSHFKANRGPGLWLDESVYDMIVVNNEMRDNTKHGVSLEISSKAVFANNVVTNNHSTGLKVNNTSDVKLWNNTFIGNDRSVWLVQDSRLPTSASSVGRDPRRPFPDPTMTWLLGPVTMANNVLSYQRSGDCMLCVEDTSSTRRSAEQMGIDPNGNVYNRANTSSPATVVLWARAGTSPYAYATLNSFKNATGREAAGYLVDGPAAIDVNSVPTGSMPTSSTALPLPSDVAALVSQPAGAQHRGAWPR